MLSALVSLSEFDYTLLKGAVELTNQYEWLATIAYLAAQVLIFIFPLALLVLWYRPDLNRGRHGAQKSVVLAVVGVVIAFAIKSLIGFLWIRQRPFITHPDLLVMSFHTDSISFPSGHALVAFTIASTLLFSGYRRLGGWLLLAAVLVGLGRIFAGVHYPGDVIAGAVLGIGIAWYLHREASTLRRYLPDH